MKSFAVCPVSDKKVSERVARINGAFTVLFLIVFLLTQSIIPVVFLVIDFLLRGSGQARYSPFAIVSKSIVSYFGWNENLINAGPKLFAARIGFLFSSLIVLAFIINAFPVAFILAGILGLFSFLESAFGICVACEIYPFVYRLTNAGSL
jgi:hypothetical protein